MNRLLTLARIARHAPSLTTLTKRHNLIRQAPVPFVMYWSSMKLAPFRCEEEEEGYLTL